MPDIYAELHSTIVRAEQDSLNWSADALKAGHGTRHLMFLNAHGVNMALRNDEFRQALQTSDFLLRDGIGLSIAFRLLGLSKTENLNGTDLIPKILHRDKTRRLAVWGSSAEAIEKLGDRLRAENRTNIVSLQHGFHDDPFYIDEFLATRPDIVVLCMGMPRQELLARKLSLPGHDCLVICGGGWANFYSGHTKRAPGFIRKLRMEWLYRLAHEPIRLGRRYTIDILRYLVTLVKIRLQRDRTLT